MPATPKPPGQRRRRNLGQGQWKELPAKGSGRKPPEPATDRELGEIAKAYWETLWSSPMGSTFTDADVQPLTRLAVLVDDRARAESGDTLVQIVDSEYRDEVKVVIGEFTGDAEIRQLEDRFGISPLARRRLQWEIKQAEGQTKRTRGSRHLKAVETG